MSKHKGDVLGGRNGLVVIDCVKCGYAHLDPLPSQADLDRLYDAEFYERDKPLFVKEHREDAAWWLLTYRDLLTRWCRRILDYGCGPGFFLAEAESLGVPAAGLVGVEPSPYARAVAGQLTGARIIPRLEKQDRDFDFILLYEVLEHLLDPIAVLEDLRDRMAEDGEMCIVVPNDFSRLQECVTCWDECYWVHPHHVNYFNWDSLPVVLLQAGLEIKVRWGSWPMEWFLLGGENYLESAAVGRDCHRRRCAIEMNMTPDVREDLRIGFANARVGRECIVFARKSEKRISHGWIEGYRESHLHIAAGLG